MIQPPSCDFLRSGHLDVVLGVLVGCVCVWEVNLWFMAQDVV